MSVDRYAGSAGGQPRLLIPTIDRIVDPATKQAMNQILRWANTLLLGASSGGLLAYGFYTSSSVGNPVSWNESSASFAYVASGLISFPPDSVNLIITKFNVSAFEGSLTDPVELGVAIQGNAGVTNLDAGYFTGAVNTTSDAYSAAPIASFLFDTSGPFAGDAPLQVFAFINNHPNTPLDMSILSWSIP